MLMKKYFTIGTVVLIFFGASLQLTEAATTTTSFPTQSEVEERVREYFEDTPVMIQIARCESNFRQYTDSGSVLRGGNGGGMVGVFQFFESVHAGAATNLGHDITTLEGNLAYAKHVYKSEGTSPWNSAKDCWDVLENNTSNTDNTNLNPKEERLKLQIELLLKIIELLKELQRLQA